MDLPHDKFAVRPIYHTINIPRVDYTTELI